MTGGRGDGGSASRIPTAILVAAALTALAPRLASADEGEWLVGGQAVGELPAAGGLAAVVQRGLGDVLALRASAGGLYDGSRLAGEVTAGAVWAWDVLVWVPELVVAGGVRVGSSVEGELSLGLGVRRFVSLDTSVTIGLTGGYRTGGERYGALALGFWWRLP